MASRPTAPWSTRLRMLVRVISASPRSARTRAAPTPSPSGDSTPGSAAASSTTAAWPRTWPSCSRRAARSRAPRWSSPRRGCARSSPASRIRPARPPGACWPASAGGAETAAAGRPRPARPRCWRPSSRRWSGRAARAEGSSPPNAPTSARPSTASSPGCSSWPGCVARKPRRSMWRDVTAAREGDGLLVAVRRGKTNPDGETIDVRFVKGDVARAVRMLCERRGASPGAGRHRMWRPRGRVRSCRRRCGPVGPQACLRAIAARTGPAGGASPARGEASA